MRYEARKDLEYFTRIAIYHRLTSDSVVISRKRAHASIVRRTIAYETTGFFVTLRAITFSCFETQE